ncbi:type III-B CRISPR module-associated protein Cmr3 [Candidatus Chlorohelix sp.]|uniref:type III-B CRISPR module-associated protein Cmr3 n=1 Tax=Candidatus Chlorohelix sp. TaxID=3139201 RepID=UPI0030651818
MKLFFQPSDFLFFRDNKPFAAGENYGGKSRELPPPSVLYGAIRTWLLQDNDIALDKFGRLGKLADISDPVIRVTGTKSESGTLQIKGPFFANQKPAGVESYFPQPLDLVKYKATKASSDKPFFRSLQPKKLDNYLANWRGLNLSPLLPTGELADDEVTGGFLSKVALEAYLEGRSIARINTIDAMIESESRIGIAVGKEGVTQSGQFYTLQGNRFVDGYGLAVDIEGLNGINLATQGLRQLGGERRFGFLTEIADEIAPQAPEIIGNKFKLALATPAIFEGGWLPSWIDRTSGEGSFSGLKVRLVAAAVGRAETISGFDMALGRPKPIRKAVPAGSVYYFELLEGAATEIVNIIHNQTISDELAHAGFGLAFVGSW